MSEWERVLDEGSGAYYYFNQDTEESSWEVPEGYVDDETEQAAADTSESATADMGASEGGTGGELVHVQNPDWEEVLDESSGAYYYVNHVTSENVWDQPPDFYIAGGGGGGASAATPEKSSAAAHAPISINTQAVVISDDANPDYWAAHWDDDNQMYYYMNSATLVTQWEMPDCINPEIGAANEAAANVNSSSSGSNTLTKETVEEESSAPNTPIKDTEMSSKENAGSLSSSSSKNLSPHEDKATSKSNSPPIHEEGFAFSLLDSLEHDPNGGKVSNHHKKQAAIMSDLFGSGTHSEGTNAGDLNSASDGGNAGGMGTEANTVMEENPISSDTPAPVIDVMLLKPKQSLAEIKTFLAGIQFKQFVDKHFRNEGFTGALGLNEGDRRGIDMNQSISAGARSSLMSWSADAIKLSLCVMNDPESVESAVVCNRSILGYMTDRATSKSPSELIDILLEESRQGTDRLRDELFCQIIKQLNNNPNPLSEEKGWHLLAICLACVSPSKYFSPYLMAFCLGKAVAANGDPPFLGRQPVLAQRRGNRRANLDFAESQGSGGSAGNADTLIRAHETKKECIRLAELCLRYAIKSSKSFSQRSHAPTDVEIAALISGESLSVVVFFIENSEVPLPVDSWTTVHDCETRISQHLNLKEETRCMFCLYEQLCGVRQVGSDEHALQGFERITDILAFHKSDSKKNAPGDKEEVYYRFVFKARLLLDGEVTQAAICDADPVCTRLLYMQAVNDVLTCKYPLTRPEAVLLAAIQAQVTLGDLQTLRAKLGFGRASRNKNTEDTLDAVSDSKQMSETLAMMGFTNLNMPDAETKFEGTSSNNEVVEEDEKDEQPYVNVFVHTPIDHFLSKQYTGGVMDEARKFAAEKSVTEMYAKFHGMDKFNAMLTYLRVIRGSPVYGAHFFFISQSSDLSKSREEILAITCRCIIIIEPSHLSYTSQVQLSDVLSWGYSHDSLMLEIAHQNMSSHDFESQCVMVPPKKYYKTQSAKEIADLLQAYSVNSR